ncbi:F-box domain containing protein [Pandoravirus quercus]|uniref:F-box domain containing protein n=1 Tax=Pandoravirus quercus TaxID=2107709 RepID=A0A2U7UAL2_9VIRU|nr:F-box domain containing protein [Pandoravirus quercus]AVK75469.1 F-box domain containing protein [Pandoravirus quercus]
MACECGRVDGPCVMGDEDKWDEDGNRFMETDVFGLLPDEMMRAILSWLSGADLARVSCVSVRLRDLIDDPTLWEGLCRASLAVPDVRPLDDRRADVGPHADSWLDNIASLDKDPCPPPLPELPPPTLVSVDPQRKPWRWLYAACHRRVVCPTARPLGGPSWWTRWRPWQVARRPGHVVRGERIGTAALIVIEVGDLDDQGRLAGFGLRATCARPSDAAPWRWAEWAWGTWHGGRIQGLGRVCAASGAAHTGRFMDGIAHGRGVRTMPAQCRHTLGATTASIHTSSSNINAQEYPIPCHAVEVSGCWRAGKAHGRLVQATSCGDVWVSLWNRGVLTGIESLLLPPRPATDGRPAFGGVRIEGVSWRVEDVASAVRGAAISKGLFGRCVIAVPADAKALDIYLDYVRAGHPCLSADMAAAVLGAGTRIRAALTVRPNLDQ